MVKRISRNKSRWIFNFSNIISSFLSECIVMGDFNEIGDDFERLGSNFNMSFARIFNDFIDSLDLVDIPLGGA